MSEGWWLVPGCFVVALLYASVGHGGASGYLALLSLVPTALKPAQMATTALTLNVLVAAIALATFARAGHVVGRLTWPFIVASIPAALWGGLMTVSVRLYEVLLAVALGVAAFRLTMERDRSEERSVVPPRLVIALPVGAGIGWLSGVVGVGGGVFLSPLLLLLGWATTRQAAGAAALFILVNSVAALVGRAVRQGLVYGHAWPLLIAALLGGLIGARLGANHFSGRALKRLLAVVLATASIRSLIR